MKASQEKSNERDPSQKCGQALGKPQGQAVPKTGAVGAEGGTRGRCGYQKPEAPCCTTGTVPPREGVRNTNTLTPLFSLFHILFTSLEQKPEGKGSH